MSGANLFLYALGVFTGSILYLAVRAVLDDYRRRKVTAKLDPLGDEDRPIVFATPPTRYVQGKVVSRGPGVPSNPPGDEES